MTTSSTRRARWRVGPIVIAAGWLLLSTATARADNGAGHPPPQWLFYAYWAALITLSAFFLRLACSLTQADMPSWRRAYVSVVVVGFLAYLAADFTAYMLMRSLQDVVLQIPPWYSFSFWFREPLGLKWNIISYTGPLKYLPFVFALCAAGTLQVFVLQAQVNFRVGLFIVLLQWFATAVAAYIIGLVLGVVLQGVTLPDAPLIHSTKTGESASLHLPRRDAGEIAQASKEYAEKAWHNLKGAADPYLDELKTELDPAIKHLPQPVQDWLADGGWWIVLGVFALLTLAWLRSLVQKLMRPRRRVKKKKRKKVGYSLKENLKWIGDAVTDERADRLTVRGLPARLRLIVLSAGTRGGQAITEEMSDRVLDWIKPGLAKAAAGDYPGVRVWPPFFSNDGFASAFDANVKIPEPKGTQSHWVLVSGEVTIGKQILHVGLGFFADEENTVRRIKARQDQWVSIIGIKAAAPAKAPASVGS